MFIKYRNYILLTAVLFMFPTCIEKIGSANSRTGNEAYLNWEYFHLHGELAEFRAFSQGIARYGEIIRQESEKQGWDWRLIAAIVFRESGFNPKACSPAGATGLMQLMPGTLLSYGINNATDPAQNIRGGLRMLNWLNEQYTKEIPDYQERIKFILASYNTGYSRLHEARKMAARMGKNPDIWDDHVEFVFSDQCRALNRPVPGQNSRPCGSEETYDFVRSVLDYYNRFLAFLPY